MVLGAWRKVFGINLSLKTHSTHLQIHSLTVLAATVVSPSRVNVKMAFSHGHDEKSVAWS